MANKQQEKFDIEVEMFFDEENKQVGGKGNFKGDNIKIFSGFDTAMKFIGFVKEAWTGSKEESKTK